MGKETDGVGTAGIGREQNRTAQHSRKESEIRIAAQRRVIDATGIRRDEITECTALHCTAQTAQT